jgi:sec-independent protein translocase protein TatB
VLDLSPTKLLIIFVVAVLLLGPKKLPQVARQLGAGWRRLREMYQQMDREVRRTVPDLPSSQEIVRFARSPVARLNQRADIPGAGRDGLVEDPAAPSVDGAGADLQETPAADAARVRAGELAPSWEATWATARGLDRDDPNLN